MLLLMGRRTKHTSGDAGGRGGPILGWVENGPQCVYNEGRGGPVHHTMVGPRRVTREVKKLPAQSRTRFCGCMGRNADSGKDNATTRGDGL